MSPRFIFFGEDAGYAPILITAPVLTGGHNTGNVLSVTNGTWDADPAPTFTYTWIKWDGAGLAGTLNTHTITSPEYSPDLLPPSYGTVCQVTATNAFGVSMATSNQQLIYDLPYIVSLPIISSSAGHPVGIGDILSTTDGVYLDGTVTGYQWRVNGFPLVGENSSTYTVISVAPATYDCVITYTNGYGSRTASGIGYPVP